MTDLFEQVFHHIEGTETEIQNWQTLDGIKTVEFPSFGPDRWIESVHENGRLMAIDCLAMILFTVAKSFDREHERRIVEIWAVELRKAVSAGEIQARDPVTLLVLETLPDGWEWLLSMADADKFIAARGMEWRFGEVALHLFNEFEQAIQNRRFPPWTRTAPATVTTPAQSPATPAPMVAASDGPAPLRTVINSTKARRDTLTPVIEQAQKQCTDPSDTAAVWAALLVLAEKKTAPLIGATEEGLQYLKGGTAEIFKRKSLGQRLAR